MNGVRQCVILSYKMLLNTLFPSFYSYHYFSIYLSFFLVFFLPLFSFTLYDFRKSLFYIIVIVFIIMLVYCFFPILAVSSTTIVSVMFTIRDGWLIDSVFAFIDQFFNHSISMIMWFWVVSLFSLSSGLFINLRTYLCVSLSLWTLSLWTLYLYLSQLYSIISLCLSNLSFYLCELSLALCLWTLSLYFSILYFYLSKLHLCVV